MVSDLCIMDTGDHGWKGLCGNFQRVDCKKENFFFFFSRMGIQNGHIVPFLECASLRKRKRKAIRKIKQKYKISKKGKKKNHAIWSLRW